MLKELGCRQTAVIVSCGIAAVRAGAIMKTVAMQAVVARRFMQAPRILLRIAEGRDVWVERV
jgi:hypothetical protein